MNGLNVSISSVTMSDGTTVDFSEVGVVVFVGPNNAGKSQALSDMVKTLRNGGEVTVVKSVDLGTRSTADEFESWVKSAAARSHDRVEEEWQLPHNPNMQTMATWRHWWSNAPPFEGIAMPLVRVLDVSQRLLTLSDVDHANYAHEINTSPLHWLYTEPQLAEQLNVLAHAAFEEGTTVHRFAGRQVRLLYGDPPPWDGSGGIPTEAYVETLMSMPGLDDQGDGVRSFVAQAVELLVGGFQWLFIDEPEAFLHSPQARTLGRILADHTREGRQTVIATHSRQLLQGLLSVDGAEVIVVRVTREGDVNPTAVLRSSDVRSLWSDPMLKYSDALDGLFHETVVICEGDMDCRFYQAALDSVCEEDDVRQPDFLWMNTAGKDRMPKAAAALAGLDVPVAVVADFDILRDVNPLRKLVEVLGGTRQRSLALRC